MVYLRSGEMKNSQETKYDLVQRIGILYQAILSIVAVIMIIFFIIDAIFAGVALAMLSLLLLCMAFNNHILFKRKYFTLLYVGCAVLLIIMLIQEIL